MSILKNIFNSNEQELKRLWSIVKKIEAYDGEMTNLTDDELRARTDKFRQMIAEGIELDDILPEAFAVVREASWRVLGMKHFPVQLLGGIVLHQGSIAEMKTGEGKTLTAALASYLNSLTGDPVYVITVNEYLATRDFEEIGKIHEFLGLKVGLNISSMDVAMKQVQYSCDIIYGTNSEFAFDYLRDNLLTVKESIVQPKHFFAIVDEVDSILIDDARTPLIISGTGVHASAYYEMVDKFVKVLDHNDYEKDDKSKSINLSDDGMDKAENVFGLNNIADYENTELIHHIRQSLFAYHFMRKDQDYVVKNSEIMIVDRFTGRILEGRRYSNGLHQALEAKEGLEIQKESHTLATITYQSYFKLYKKIAGMTGTAYTDREEFRNFYGLRVVQIPTNMPMIRQDVDDLIFPTKKAKLNAIIEKIRECYQKGQPVLIGTIFIDQSEEISDLLIKNKIPHRVLNAKQDASEAEIISNAGQLRAVTIATNMAGRGTDIKLGDGVKELGGLFILGTEKHEARRIDNQLRGRSGRQGDPGCSQFFISLEDEMLVKAGAEKIKAVLDGIDIQDDNPLRDPIATKAIETIQKNIEAINYSIRKYVIEFDEVLNKQRTVIYNDRNKILDGADMGELIRDIIYSTVKRTVHKYISKSPYPEDWDIEGLKNEVNSFFNTNLDFVLVDDQQNLDAEELLYYIVDNVNIGYDKKLEEFGHKEMNFYERLFLMKSIDKYWVQHLDLVDQMREFMNFQSIGQKNPLHVYNDEAHHMFDDMLIEIQTEAVKLLFGLQPASKEEMEFCDEQEKLKKEADRKALEDKYLVSIRSMQHIPDNLQNIPLTININSNEDIMVDAFLYYMDEGWEKLLPEYTQKINGKGNFQVILPNKSDVWDRGWYQLKIKLKGATIKNVDFVIVDAKEYRNPLSEIRSQNAKSSGKKLFIPHTKELITFEGTSPVETDSIDVAIEYLPTNNVDILNIPLNHNKFALAIKMPENGWPLGEYILHIIAEKRVIEQIDFAIVTQYIAQASRLNIVCKNEFSKYKYVNVKLMNHKDKNRIASFEIPSENKDFLDMNLELPDDQRWQPGLYDMIIISESGESMNYMFLVDINE